MGRRAGSKNLDYDRTRAELVERLSNRILSSTKANLSFRELAQAGGVSPSTLRHYFTSREAVLSAVLERVHEMGLRYVAEGATAERGAARESLRWFLGYLVEGWMMGVGRAHAVGLTEGIGHTAMGPAYLRSLLEPTLHSAEARIALHVARGELGPCDPRLAALELVSPVILVLLHQHALGGTEVRRLPLEPFLDEHVSRFLRAFGALEGGRVL
ncbi:MAG: TetR/AcrR family transcriptional regulator [Anaeromyxobacteraceae bacterium]